MTDTRLLDCFEPELVKLERMNYFPRQLLDADAMRSEQEYFLQKMRRHNRFLHGWGVVCGLKVTPPAEGLPWQVKVEPGYALGPYGDEIYVAEPVHIDLARCGPGAVTDPCEPDLLRPGRSGTGGSLFLAVKYAECVAKPVRVMPAGCACEEEACEYSRIRDSFQIECLTELPPSHEPQPDTPTLCDFVEGKLLPPCPPCPSDPWVVLAHVTLPESPARSIADSNIDNFIRRQVFSTALLQDQLIKCCCKDQTNLVLKKSESTIKDDMGVVQAIRYKIVIRNEGPSAAKNVIVKDTPSFDNRVVVDRTFGFEPADVWEQPEPNAQNIVAKLGTMTDQEQTTLRYSVKVAGIAGTYRNIATVSSDTFEENLQDNTDETVTEVAPIIG